jgi:UrcA family protein
MFDLRTPGLALTAMATLCLAGGAQAAPAQNDDVPSVVVKYADLNLDSEAGAKALLRRVNHAARMVCGEQNDDPISRLDFAIPACVRRATDQAVERLGNATVTAMNQGARTTAVASSSRP